MTSPDGNNTDLTKNQSLVMNVLSNAGGPLSAYTILDELREEGLRAPPQVYRALDKLVELGLIHRLESLNAFVACRHPGCDDEKTIAFMICETCGKVSELTDEPLSGRLRELASNAEFALNRAIIELRGTCLSCRSSAR